MMVPENKSGKSVNRKEINMRLFIAIRFSEKIRTLLLEGIASLQSQSLSGHFTTSPNLHLTLAFIGETSNVPAIRRAMDGLSAAPFSLTVGGAGRFGDLWWAGVEENPALIKLVSQLRAALDREGFSVDPRPFHPHITLGRQIVPKGKISLFIPAAAMTVEQISLMKSERIGGRLTYTALYQRSLF